MQTTSGLQLMPPNGRNFGPHKERTVTRTEGNRFVQQKQIFANVGSASRNDSKVEKEEYRKIFKSNPGKVLTGNIDRVIKWYRLLNIFCHYEVFGPVFSMQDGTIKTERIIILQQRQGSTLRVVYCVTDFVDVKDFNVGLMLRCMGIMIGPNVFRAFKIKEATNEEQVSLQRLCYLCDHAVSALCR